VSPGPATAHKFEEFLEFGLLTNSKNSSYIAQIRGIPRIRGGIPPLRVWENAKLNAQVHAQVVLLFSFNIRTLRADLWSVRRTIHLESDDG